MAKFKESGPSQVLDTFIASNGGRQVTSARDNNITLNTFTGDLHIYGAYEKTVQFNLQHFKYELQGKTSNPKLATSKFLEISNDDDENDTLPHLELIKLREVITESEPYMGVDIEEWRQKHRIYKRVSEADYRCFSNTENLEQVQECLPQQDLFIPNENILTIEEVTNPRRRF